MRLLKGTLATIADDRFSLEYFSFCPQAAHLFGKYSLFPEHIPRYIVEADARLKSKERCESTRWPTPAARGLPQRTVSRSVGTPRKQFPRHAEIVRRSPGVAWIRFEARARFRRAACRTSRLFFFFFLHIFDRRDSTNRFQTDTRHLTDQLMRSKAPLSPGIVLSCHL